MAYTFTADAVTRIRAAVRRIEQTPAALRGAERTPNLDAGMEFWAMLLHGDSAGRYTMVRVTPDPAQLNPAAFVPIDGDGIRWGIDDNEVHVDAGREANGNRNVPMHTVVKVTFCGYDPDGKPVFVFFYPKTQQDAGLPVHDHRDNLNGGFAFSVFAPGTAIPQHNYAL